MKYRMVHTYKSRLASLCVNTWRLICVTLWRSQGNILFFFFGGGRGFKCGYLSLTQTLIFFISIRRRFIGKGVITRYPPWLRHWRDFPKLLQSISYEQNGNNKIPTRRQHIMTVGNYYNYPALMIPKIE